MPGKSRLHQAIYDLKAKIKDKSAEGYDNLYFRAVFMRNGKATDTITRGDASDGKSLSNLLRSYEKTERPEQVRIELYEETGEGGRSKQLWAREYNVEGKEEVTGQQPARRSAGELGSLDGSYGGLGLAEVNEMFDKRLSEYKRNEEASRNLTELEQLRADHEVIKAERDELKQSMEKRNRIESVVTVVGAAFPGIAGMFQGTPLAPMAAALAGTGNEQPAAIAPKDDSARGVTLSMLGDFLAGLPDQELGAVQAIATVWEADHSHIMGLYQHYNTPPSAEQPNQE